MKYFPAVTDTKWDIFPKEFCTSLAFDFYFMIMAQFTKLWIVSIYFSRKVIAFYSCWYDISGRFCKAYQIFNHIQSKLFEASAKIQLLSMYKHVMQGNFQYLYEYTSPPLDFLSFMPIILAKLIEPINSFGIMIVIMDCPRLGFFFIFCL